MKPEREPAETETASQSESKSTPLPGQLSLFAPEYQSLTTEKIAAASATNDPPTIRSYTASDGYRLHYRYWEPAAEKPLGYIVALHGIQSHSGWYEYSSQLLCDAGYDVRFLDRRGSGLNEDQRGHAPHADRLINDVAQALTEVRTERNRVCPLVPVILMGVSWGGKLATVTCAKRPELADALALLYPGICAKFQPTGWQRFLLRLGHAFEKDEKRIDIPLNDPTLFTGEKQWQEYLAEDELSLHQTTLGFLHASDQLDTQAQKAPHRIHCPSLMMLAGRDDIIDTPASARYFQQFDTSHRTLHTYEDARHTLEFEPDREDIFTDLLNWLATLPELCV